jgi:isoquinoline 1-oxidoreductase subunit alpha
MITLTINGVEHQVDVDPSTPLLWVLRDHLGMTGTKYGCGIEVCGACTVIVDNEYERSCDMDVGEAQGRQITTVEGLGAMMPSLQQAWIAHQVPQCGYCQSGMLMAAAALLRQNGNPTDADIDEAMDNICACGTYQRIRAAIHTAAAALRNVP